MREVPYKNIEAVLVDVKNPRVNYRDVARSKTLDIRDVQFPKRTRRGMRKISIGVSIAAFLIMAGGVATGFVFLKGAAVAAREKTAAIAGNIIVSAESLKNLEPEKARAHLTENKETLQEIESFLSRVRAEQMAGSLGGFIPVVKDSLGLIKNISSFNFQLLALTERISDLQTNGFRYFQENGQALIRGLREARKSLGIITNEASEIKNKTGRLDQSFDFLSGVHEKVSEEYLSYASQFHLWNGALDALIGFLDSKIDKHIALFFHNPSELRPAGGFIGSYGDLIINEGRMTQLEVQDIYWPDHPMNFERKVMPPEPLRYITEDWGARDGNWFFDFPTSAETVLGFLESSKVYKENNVRFEGALAINTNVLKSLLRFVGPIPVEEYGMAITEDNFLSAIQREVETGKDKQEKKNPKKILSVIAPRLLEGLGGLDEEKKKALLQALGDHFKEKDIMLYMRDHDMQTLAETQGVDGSTYVLPHGFWGSYLAVVGANIAGGKSDVFVKETIEARIDVAADGGSFTDVLVRRTHNGKNEEDWWYRAENKTYTQIFAEPEARLIALEGQSARPRLKKAVSDYEEEKYEVLEEVKKLEADTVYLTDMNAWSAKSFGKMVVGAWFDTPAGETRELRLRYATEPEQGGTLYEGKKYHFIFEKQSGREASVKAVITAPMGYMWRETNDAVYVFEAARPKSREMAELTLTKTRQ